MDSFFFNLLQPASPAMVAYAITFMRVSIGILTIFHGLPKIMGGWSSWKELGTFMLPLGINFLLPAWGLLGACTEFFGGMLLAVGFATRIASFCLTFMMFVATVWHLRRGDPFTVYSFPLSLLFIFAAFVWMGGGAWSIDQYLTRKL